MLETLILIVFVSISSVIIGLPFIIFFNRSSTIVIDEHKIILSFFTGLSLISLYSAWATLFAPLHIYTTLPIIVISLLLLLYNKDAIKWNSSIEYSKNKLEIAVYVTACLLYIQLGSLEPYMADTKTYHLQTVRWAQQFRTIPGLANLGPRFCFPSNWFHLISSFSFPGTQDNLQYLNTALSIWFTFFLLIKICEYKARLTVKEHQLFACVYLFLFLFMTAGWNLLRGNCRSLGNDFIVTTLTLYILMYITEGLIPKNKGQKDLWIIILLTVSIPFYKLSGSFILIPLLIFFIQTKQPLKVYGYTTLLALLFGIPFLLKNYIQTGYIFYPYTLIDIFSPDWKLPPAMMERFMRFNYLSNKYIYQGTPDEASSHLPFDWLHSWFYKLALYDQILLATFIISLLFLVIRRNHQKPYFKKIIFYLVFTIPIVITWFLLSPDPRFIYAYLLFTTLFLFVLTAIPYLSATTFKAAYTFFIAGMLFFFLFKIIQFRGPLLEASPAPKPNAVKVVINNYQFNMPLQSPGTGPSYCSDITVPCIYQINPYLQMRGTAPIEGFKMKQHPDSAFLKNYIF